MKKSLAMTIVSAFLLVGCGSDDQINEEDNLNEEQIEEDTEQNDGGGEEDEQENDEVIEERLGEEENDEDVEGKTYEETAAEVIEALKEKDMDALAERTHPSIGLLFSPYGFIDEESAKVFSDEEVAALFTDSTVYNWGAFDGSGEPIELTFSEYYERFVYDEDYENAPEQSVNERLGEGNTIDNNRDVFPEGTVIEYHFPEIDPQYQGMDWRSLRLVLLEEEGKWYIAAIVHDEWTI